MPIELPNASVITEACDLTVVRGVEAPVVQLINSPADVVSSPPGGLA